jgi:hypothetical protein
MCCCILQRCFARNLVIDNMGTWQFDPENDKTILELQAERAALSNDDSATRLTPMTPTASISTLRQKLQDKIDSLRKGRKGPLDEVDGRPDTRGMGGETDAQPDEIASDDGSLSDGDNDTLASRDEMLEARRKKRGEVRDNRRRRRKEERRAGKEGSQKRGSEIKPGDKSKTTDFTAKPGKVSARFDLKRTAYHETADACGANDCRPVSWYRTPPHRLAPVRLV